MTMPILSPREIERLSAFLDGQLSAKESAALQRDLAQRSDLRDALEALRETRALLRHAPRRKVPRNFMLKPQMVAARRRPVSRPVFSLGLASVLATIFLLLSVMLEFVPTPSFGASAPMAPVVQLVQDAGASRNAATQAPQPTQAPEMSRATAASTAAPAALPTTVQKAIEATKSVAGPLSTPTVPDQMRSTGGEPPSQTTPQAPLHTRAAESTQVMQVAPTRPPSATQAAPTIQPTTAPADAEPKLGAQPTLVVPEPGGKDTSPVEARRTLTWLQTVLVVLAVVTAVAALYLRRKH